MRMRVQTKLLVLFLVECFVLVGAGIGINSLIKHHYNERLLTQINGQIDTAAEKFQRQLYDIDKCVLELSISNETNVFSMLEWKNNSASIYEKSKLLHQQLYTLKSNYKGLDRMWLIFTLQERQITDSLRYDKIDYDFHEMLLSGSDGYIIQNSDLYYVTLLSTSKKYGKGSLVAASVSLSELLEEFLVSVSGVEARLTSLGETIIGSTFTQEADITLPKEWQKAGKAGFTMAYPIVVDPEQSALIYLEIFLPHSSLNISQQNYLIWTTILILTAIAEILIFSDLLQRLVTKPLNTLLHAFEKVAHGDMNVKIQYNKQDDFSGIYHQFNENISWLRQLIDKEYKSQLAIRNAELKYLQAQINPHFLYNVFYQVYRLCRAEGADESAEFALLLSGYYEYITHDYNSGGVVRLAEEVNQTEKYMQIQQLRFGDHIQFEFDIPENMQEHLVPKLILQPIIENMVKHGFEEKYIRNDLFVKMTGKMTDDYLLIMIEDNEAELSDADIEGMQQKLSVSDSIYGKSGLVNVNERLKMVSSEGGITLLRSELGGLLVKMIIEKRGMNN